MFLKNKYLEVNWARSWFLIFVPSRGTRQCPLGSTCNKTNTNPNNNYTSFDNFGMAMLTCTQLITLDFWEDVYGKVGHTYQFRQHCLNPRYCAYLTIFLCFGFSNTIYGIQSLTIYISGAGIRGGHLCFLLLIYNIFWILLPYQFGAGCCSYLIRARSPDSSWWFGKLKRVALLKTFWNQAVVFQNYPLYNFSSF